MVNLDTPQIWLSIGRGVFEMKIDILSFCLGAISVYSMYGCFYIVASLLNKLYNKQITTEKKK